MNGLQEIILILNVSWVSIIYIPLQSIAAAQKSPKPQDFMPIEDYLWRGGPGN